ncbi:MAG TPA: alpha/beta hydrolase [Kofleriaceae bacterium]|jgi:pimeloyl-ACP methyl ester carboxylesterase
MFRAALVVMLLGSVALAEPTLPPKTIMRWQTLPPPSAMPAAAATGEVETGGAKIHYAWYGLDGAPTVILLHGGLGNSDHWANQVPALGAKYHVLAIDSRAQGRSTRGDLKLHMSYDLMAKDVIAVMDKLAIKRASIVGWSDGGEVALKLGIAFPDRVGKLFVFGANYNDDGSKPRGDRTPTFIEYSARCKSQFATLSPDKRPWATAVDQVRPLWRDPIGITKGQLKAIAAPVMMADGDHDEVIVIDQEKEMAKLIPHGQMHVFENASHFTLWQDPDDFNAVVLDFLKD